MPARNTSRGRRGFGVILGGLRDKEGESQQALADRLHVSRSTIASTETGTAPTATLVNALISSFPEQADEIAAVARRFQKFRRAEPKLSAQDWAFRNKIETLIATTELQEAKMHLDARLSSSSEAAAEQQIWMLERLSIVEVLLGNANESRAVLEQAIDRADNFISEHIDATRIALRLKLAVAFDHDNRVDQALELLDAGLAVTPTSPELWYRKAVTLWNRGDLGSALASLEQALRYRGARQDILFIRGQIFAEWGRSEEAIADLKEIIADPNTPLQRGQCAVSAYAYALYNRYDRVVPLHPDWGKTEDEARSILLAMMEKAPSSPWPHYFRAFSLLGKYETSCYFICCLERAGWMEQVPSLWESTAALGAHINDELDEALKRGQDELSEYRLQKIESLRVTLTHLIPDGCEGLDK